mgnify:CR=1 FL=1
MGKVRLSSRFWFFAAVILVGLGVNLYFYARWTSARQALADYRLADTCPAPENCRRKVPATIQDSQSMAFNIRGGKSPSIHETIYSVSVSAPEIGARTVQISSNPPSNGTQFDGGDVRIPTGYNPNFTEDNFPKARVVYIEVWRAQVTFIYLDTLVENYSPLTVELPSTNPFQLAVIENSPPPGTYSIALPTNDHPLLVEAGRLQDLIGAALVFLVALLAIYSGQKGRLIRIERDRAAGRSRAKR